RDMRVRYRGMHPLIILSIISASFSASFSSGVTCGKRHKRVTEISLADEKLDGVLPPSIGNLTFLRVLNLSSSSSLHGEIPKEIGHLCRLQHINLERNRFEGRIPAELGNCSNLQKMIISHNNFSGPIPIQFASLSRLIYLYVNGNFLVGEMPSFLRNLSSLVGVDLNTNHFHGEIQRSIPASLGLLRSLVSLDLSNNKLSGQIPKDLASITSLQNLNFSFNRLEGELPLFKNTSAVSVTGNRQLCGGNPELHLQTCKNNLRKKGAILSRKDSLAERYKRVTYIELFKATDGFAKSNLIGTGSFGDVYKAAILDQNESKPVAVKVLKLSNEGAAKSFIAECKILRRIRHRNLLSVITSCSSLDNKGNDFKALVFEFMSNGTLDDWLHLPSKILLDDDMVAHVGDFGLAKLLLGASGDFRGGESMSTALKGSFGYIAPEYGMGAAVSPQGDIYSYGILLLELITGRRPTNDIFKDEMSIQSFCERAQPDRVDEIVDQSLLDEFLSKQNPEQIKLQYYTFLISFIEVGISCAAESPRDRMHIQSAIQSLKRRSKKNMIPYSQKRRHKQACWNTTPRHKDRRWAEFRTNVGEHERNTKNTRGEMS
uniref:Protein kinase domain-containing protein n=1 Tax=Kalanchoe fedtschenkoi TaxID=63787 RepID=A0A7N0ZSI9_KALFE